VQRALVSVSLLAALAFGLGCGGTETPPSPTGTIWRWIELRGPDAMQVPHPSRYTLELGADGGYTFRADCNTGGGAYEIHGGQLDLGPAASTQAACPPGSLGSRFAASLRSTVGYSRVADRLVLDLADGAGSLLFAPQEDLALAGSTWLVRAVMSGKRGVVSTALGSTITASFDAEGRVSGSTGCNRYSAEFAVQGDALEIGTASATRKVCSEPERVMQREAELLIALGTVARFEQRGERLQLRTADRALAVDLVSALTGTLTYRVPRQLPPDARVRVTLEDVSLADAPASVLGEQVFPTHGRQVPLSFEVSFDPAEIDPRHSYGIRALIESPDGEALFRTARPHPVLTPDASPFDVDVVLEPAG
jgi:putative lipoprotein